MTVRIMVGDVRVQLAALPANYFDTIITSPPYWGLRDYGTAIWLGGDPDCDHRSPTMLGGRDESRAMLAGSHATNSGQLLLAHRSGCGRCGAVKVDQQIGLEATLGEHLAVMVELGREFRRVLKPTGTFWLNYGDCYATSPNGRSHADRSSVVGGDDRTFRDKPFSTIGRIHPPAAGNPFPDVARRGGGNNSDATLKAKDLCMIPNRLAIALQDDGWWVRSENVWGKTNPMPESINDRPATAHEKVFLLTKGPRYFYDPVAVRQGLAPTSIDRLAQDLDSQAGSARANGGSRPARPMKAVGGDKQGRMKGPAEGQRRYHGFNERWEAAEAAHRSRPGRNLRNFEPAPLTVWPMATTPFACELCTDCGRFFDRRAVTGLRVEEIIDGTRKERRRYCACGSHTGWLSHFATFPPQLVERCLDAGCPVGVCSACGAPWQRLSETTLEPTTRAALTNVVDGGDAGADRRDAGSNRQRDGHIPGWCNSVETLGFAPSCGCDADRVAARVLDPFGGAGTSGLVSDQRGRDCTLIELNPQYATLAMHRIAASRPDCDVIMGGSE